MLLTSPSMTLFLCVWVFFESSPDSQEELTYSSTNRTFRWFWCFISSASLETYSHMISERLTSKADHLSSLPHLSRNSSLYFFQSQALLSLKTKNKKPNMQTTKFKAVLHYMYHISLFENSWNEVEAGGNVCLLLTHTHSPGKPINKPKNH